MWNCPECSAEVDEAFENCPQCGTGRDGSEPPVDFVAKKDAVQPGLPAAGETGGEGRKKLLSILLVLVVIAILFYIAFMP